MNFFRTLSCAMLAITAVSFGGRQSLAEPSGYRIAPGETVEISIASLSDRAIRAVVQTDGTIAIPDAGSIAIGGLTPAEMQSQLEMILPTNLFHLRSADGRIRTLTIAAGDITSSVVAYRPVYVTGDVLTPGEQPYRPLLSARQAIAFSGGYSLIHLPVAAPRAAQTQRTADPVDLQRDYESLWVNYLNELFHGERLKAEMNEQADLSVQAPAGHPLPDSVVGGILKREADGLKLALEDHAKEQKFLEDSIKAAGDQIDTLASREKVEAASQKADEDDMAKVSALFKNGDASNARVAEIRRDLMLSSSRRLSTLVELLRVRNQKADDERQMIRNKDQWRMAQLKDLQESSVRMADLEGKLKAMKTKMQYSGIVTDVSPITAEAVKPLVRISRNTGNSWQQLPADENTEILPGDIIQVSLCNGADTASASCDGAGGATTQ